MTDDQAIGTFIGVAVTSIGTGIFSTALGLSSLAGFGIFSVLLGCGILYLANH